MSIGHVIGLLMEITPKTSNFIAEWMSGKTNVRAVSSPSLGAEPSGGDWPMKLKLC